MYGKKILIQFPQRIIVNFEIKNTFCIQVCHIWAKDINIGYFVESSTMEHFRKVLKNMIDPNVKVKV
jgi:hypothetical protein